MIDIKPIQSKISEGNWVTIEHPALPWSKEKRTKGKIVQVTDCLFVIERSQGYKISFLFVEVAIGLVRLKDFNLFD